MSPEHGHLNPGIPGHPPFLTQEPKDSFLVNLCLDLSDNLVSAICTTLSVALRLGGEIRLSFCLHCHLLLSPQPYLFYRGLDDRHERFTALEPAVS